METMSEKIKTKVIRRTPKDEDCSVKSGTKSADPKTYQERHYPTLAERLAQSSVCIKNFRYPGGAALFPAEPNQRLVDLCFPYAKGGALFIDQPHDHTDLKKCLEKRPVIEELGHRYIILRPNMEEAKAWEELLLLGVDE